MINIVRIVLKYCGIFKITNVDSKDEQMEYARVISILLAIGIIIFLFNIIL